MPRSQLLRCEQRGDRREVGEVAGEGVEQAEEEGALVEQQQEALRGERDQGVALELREIRTDALAGGEVEEAAAAGGRRLVEHDPPPGEEAAVQGAGEGIHRAQPPQPAHGAEADVVGDVVGEDALGDEAGRPLPAKVEECHILVMEAEAADGLGRRLVKHHPPPGEEAAVHGAALRAAGIHRAQPPRPAHGAEADVVGDVVGEDALGDQPGGPSPPRFDQSILLLLLPRTLRRHHRWGTRLAAVAAGGSGTGGLEQMDVDNQIAKLMVELSRIKIVKLGMPPELPLQDSNPHHGIDCNCVRTNGIREQNKQQQIVLTTQVGSGIITDKQNEDQYTSGKQFSWFMQAGKP
uniref:Uncharacterized protein n=1 Tax=Oryza nivara TaxID=4536 RepID=A0A0E0IWQ5_ORYNI